ncbi:TerC family protein [Thermodesulfobacteriota bacterium]
MDYSTIAPWAGFFILVLGMLALDLGILNRKAHAIGMREAIIWSIFWTVVAVIFNIWVYYSRGTQAGLDFLTGYILERSLSLDNLFVFLMIFTYFGVQGKYQHRVLFWGIIGALVFRAFFIGAGITLIMMFRWTLYVMGAFLIFTGIKMGMQDDESLEPEKNPVIRLCRRFVPMTDKYDEGKFFTRISGKLHATPMFLVLLFVETSDIVFAFDSVPAVLAITLDPYIVFTSNVMAILGMRALYFALAALYSIFHYLKIGLSIVLVLVGVKMVIADWVHLPVWLTLSMVVVIVALSIIASMIWPPKEETIASEPQPETVGSSAGDVPEKADVPDRMKEKPTVTQTLGWSVRTGYYTPFATSQCG